VKGQWVECSPEEAAEFSAVAYGFGRNLHVTLNCPVGIIQTALGGTPAEAWSRMEDLLALPENKPFLEQSRKLAESKGGNHARLPAVLYNGMIHPFVPYGIKGAIWYQGEANVPRSEYYAKVLGKMISGWREQWQAEFPFYLVQLPSYISADKAKAEDPSYDIRQAYETDPNRFVSWTVLQEQQVKATKENSKVYMTPALEFGEPYDIHPKNKAPVAERLSRLVLGQEYGRGTDFRAPEWDGKFVQNGQTVRVGFNHAESGLKVRGDAIKGFALAGEDKVFRWAEAKLDGNTVVVQSADVKSPVYVRYIWSAFPQVTLYNASGLPVLPFRNDSFAPGIRTKEE
jgi:sialate O-acetylesterase